MQNDLISRSALINTIVNSPTDMEGYNPAYCDGTATRQNEIIDLINKMPTAYDVEKVVAELEEVPAYSFGFSLLNATDYVKLSDFIRAIEIVRNGGKE